MPEWSSTPNPWLLLSAGLLVLAATALASALSRLATRPARNGAGSGIAPAPAPTAPTPPTA